MFLIVMWRTAYFEWGVEKHYLVIVVILGGLVLLWGIYAFIHIYQDVSIEVIFPPHFFTRLPLFVPFI